MKQKVQPEYRTYMAAKMRCENPNNISYKNYGGRGIKFLYKDFKEFFKDVGEKPTPKHQIDRIENDGNYQLGNCKWSTQLEQNRNRRVKKTNLSGVRGVSFDKDSNKWVARFWTNNKNVNLGRFDNFEDAHQEYLTYYMFEYGEYPPEFMV